LANAFIAWLLVLIKILVNYLLWSSIPSLVSKSWSYIASFTAAVRAIYSNQYINSKIVAYSFNFYKISPLFNINIKPNIERLVVLSCP